MPDLDPVSRTARSRSPGGGRGRAAGDAEASGADAASDLSPMGTILARIEILGDAWTPGAPLEDGWTPEDDHRYRTLYERKDRYLGVLTYDEARVAYRVGRLGARNPELRGRSFEQVEDRLAAGWTEERWSSVKPYVRLGFDRARFDERLEESRRAVERLERGWHSSGRSP